MSTGIVKEGASVFVSGTHNEALILQRKDSTFRCPPLCSRGCRGLGGNGQAVARPFKMKEMEYPCGADGQEMREVIRRRG